jgi:hypothetical protein
VSRTIIEGDEIAEGSVIIECWTHASPAGSYEGAGMAISKGFNVLLAGCPRPKLVDNVGILTTSTYVELPKGETIEVYRGLGCYEISNLDGETVVKKRRRGKITRWFLGEAEPQPIELRVA